MVLWIALLVVLFVLLRVWLRRRKTRVTRTPNEERSIELPPQRRPSSATAAAGRAPRGEVRATDAVTAYLAALDDLERWRPAEARAESETPRAHARRIAIGPELAALQAGYALARYGGRPLSGAEHRRALGRWGRLRRRLRP
jgi:hypothetical protein